MICRDDLVEAASQTASINGLQPPLRNVYVAVRENTLLSFGRAVAFVEFDVQVRASVSRLGPCSGLDWSLQLHHSIAMREW